MDVHVPDIRILPAGTSGDGAARYGTIGFNEEVELDEGDAWATSFAVVKMSETVEQRFRALVRRAVHAA